MSETLERKWLTWHHANPHVYSLFKRFTFDAIDRGHRKFSHWLVMNRIRWETNIETTGNEFKISNDFIAYYARLFMADYPEYDGIFTIHKMKR